MRNKLLNLFGETLARLGATWVHSGIIWSEGEGSERSGVGWDGVWQRVAVRNGAALSEVERGRAERERGV